MWKETRSLTLGKQFLRNSMKTVAMVNSTSGTNRDTEMGPVHLHSGVLNISIFNIAKIFLYCTSLRAMLTC